MMETTTAEQLQRMQTRPTSGTVVGTTTDVAVPEELLRGERIPSKPGSLPTTQKSPYRQAHMEPPREWKYKALPTGRKSTRNSKGTISNNSAEEKSNFCQIK